MTQTLFEYAGIDNVNNVNDSVDVKIVQTYRLVFASSMYLYKVSTTAEISQIYLH